MTRFDRLRRWMKYSVLLRWQRFDAATGRPLGLFHALLHHPRYSVACSNGDRFFCRKRGSPIVDKLVIAGIVKTFRLMRRRRKELKL